MRQSKRYPMYWKPYVNLEKERAVGLFNWRFSDKISLGRVKKLQDDPEKWEGVFTLDPLAPEKFDSEKLAKEWVEEQVLLWTMKGGSLAEFYTNPEKEGEDEEYEVAGAEPTEYSKGMEFLNGVYNTLPVGCGTMREVLGKFMEDFTEE